MFDNNDDIFKKPEPTPEETFFQLTYDTKSQDEMLAAINAMDMDTDAEMIRVIFKKCKHHEVRIRAGKILYYCGF